MQQAENLVKEFKIAEGNVMLAQKKYESKKDELEKEEKDSKEAKKMKGKVQTSGLMSVCPFSTSPITEPTL